MRDTARTPQAESRLRACRAVRVSGDVEPTAAGVTSRMSDDRDHPCRVDDYAR